MTTTAATLTKEERIVSKKLMSSLFESSSSRVVTCFPLRAVYLLVPRNGGCPPVQFLVSVPKKRLRHAVDRNRAKRQVREAYRLNKQQLWPSIADDQSLAIAFVWMSDKPRHSHRVSQSVSHILHQIAEQL